MKPAFYEPSLCMCTPENPNTMGICVTLTEPVNCDALKEAVDPGYMGADPALFRGSQLPPAFLQI